MDFSRVSMIRIGIPPTTARSIHQVHTTLAADITAISRRDIIMEAIMADLAVVIMEAADSMAVADLMAADTIDRLIRQIV
jgi:hypothetical protein